MKIYALGKSLCQLRDKMIDQGDELVDVSRAELIMQGEMPPSLSTTGKVVFGDFGLAEQLLTAMNIEVTAHRADFFFSRWFHHDQWLPQILVGIPLFRFANNDLGPEVLAGVGMRYVYRGKVKKLFSNKVLVKTLMEMDYSGFVSVMISKDDLKVAMIRGGIPCKGLLPVLEGVRGKYSDFFLHPERTRLDESWVVGVELSRAPYPYSEYVEETRLDFPEGDVEHVFLSDAEDKRGAKYSCSSYVGMVTGGSVFLAEACEGALGICERVELGDKHYRTDVCITIASRWNKIQEGYLVGD